MSRNADVRNITEAARYDGACSLHATSSTNAALPVTPVLVGAAVGIVAGLVMGVLGGGGAVLIVPALVLMYGSSVHDAMTTSLFVVCAGASIGSVPYLRARRVSGGAALRFGVVGIPGAWVGTQLNRQLHEDALLLMFSAFVLATIVLLVWGKADAVNPSTRGRLSTPRVLGTVTAAALSGMLIGLLGVGGGVVVLPVLLIVLRMPTSHAVGTSLVVVAIASSYSIALRTDSSEIAWDLVVPMATAAALTAVFGRRLADNFSPRTLKRSFAAVLVVVLIVTLGAAR